MAFHPRKAGQGSQKSLVILCLLFGISGYLLSQDSLMKSFPSQWSLQNCIDYALKNNIDVNSLRLTARLDEQDLLQSKAAKYPSLSGSASQSLVNSRNANPVVGGFQTQANFSSNYSLSSNMILYNGGYLRNDVNEKVLALQADNLNVNVAENDISLRITQAFLNILLTRENIVYLQDLVSTSEAELKQGQIRFNAGSLSRKALVQLEAQLAADRYNLISAENTLRLNLVNLKQILQLPSSLDFMIAQPDTVVVDQTVVALPEALKMAQDTRPEIKYGETAIRIAETGLAKIRASQLPTISLGAGLSSGYSDNQTSKYLKQLSNNFYQQIGLAIGIPIYSRRSVKTNIEKSKINIQQENLSLQGSKTVLEQEVEQAYINLLNAQAAYAAASLQLKTSEESYRIETEALRIGAVNPTDLLIQKNQYIQAFQSYIQAKYSALLNSKIYNFYTGVPIKL